MNFSELEVLIKSDAAMLEKQKAVEGYLWDMVPKVNPFLYWSDVYKVSHIRFETEGVKSIYSNAMVRFAHYMKELLGDHFSDEFVVFGIQWMLLRLHTMANKGFFSRPKAEVMEEMEDELGGVVGDIDLSHFGELHDIGYLPILVKALPEGTLAPVGLPFYTIDNTLPQFRWISNYLESGMSTDTWKQLTVATVAYAFRKLSNKFAMETQGNTDGVMFQNHDFSTRGQSGFESGAINGAAFLLSSNGTDNLPALWATKNFYFTKATKASPVALAGSVAAGEHSVTTLGILTEQRRAEANGEQIDLSEAEIRYTRSVASEKFPTGIVSNVADSFDYFGFLETVVPAIKDVISVRDGKFVVRGDSGNPIHIIAGYRTFDVSSVPKLLGLTINEVMLNTHLWWKEDIEVVKINDIYYKVVDENGRLTYQNEPISEVEAIGSIQHLWNVFGGIVNNLGYKQLDQKIGYIYGDGITVQRADQILTRLKERGFASTNVVFGVGSYSLNMLSRDHLGIAIKATNAIVEINGELVDAPIYKEPKTDLSKKSDRGYLVVLRDEETGKLYKKDMQTRDAMLFTGELKDVYMNGMFMHFTTIDEIRGLLWGDQS